MKNSYYDRLYATKNGVTSDREIIRTQQLTLRKSLIRKQRLALTFVFIFIIAASFVLLSGRVYADSSVDNKVKKYKSVLVYSGDSLESLAEKYITEEYSDSSKYIKEVITINHLNINSELVPGNHVIVPYYTDSEENICMNTATYSMNPVITVSVAD